MKKLAILLLTILPFISFSQIAANETKQMNLSTNVIIETYTKTVPERKIENNTKIKTYSEEDFKMFYDVTDHSFDMGANKKNSTKGTENISFQAYSEDDFKMFYDVTDYTFDNRANKAVSTKITYPDEFKHDAYDHRASNENYTRIIRVYENPKVFYEVEVEEILDSNNKKIYQYHEPINRSSKTLLDVKQGGNQ